MLFYKNVYFFVFLLMKSIILYIYHKMIENSIDKHILCNVPCLQKSTHFEKEP